MKEYKLMIKIAKLFYKFGKRRALFEVSRTIESIRRDKHFINDFDMDSEDWEMFEKYLKINNRRKTWIQKIKINQ